MEEKDPDRDRDGGAEARPDRIGRPDRNFALREVEEITRKPHAEYRDDDGGPVPLRVDRGELEARRPAHLEGGGDEKIDRLFPKIGRFRSLAISQTVSIAIA